MVLNIWLKIILIVLFNAIKFDYFVLAAEPFAKALRSLEKCVLVNNTFWGKLFSLLESPATFGESIKVTSAPLFISDFNLLSCELENFTFKVLCWVVLYWYYIKTK